MLVVSYVRVAKQPSGKPKVAVSSKPSPEPLRNTNDEALPTVGFAVQFEIPDEAFKPAVPVAKISVNHAVPLIEVEELQL